MLWRRMLADLIVVFHAAYVSFVVLGLVAILVGIAFRWKWVRNPWFRWIHITMIGIVVAEALAGIPCPLTVWERQLREGAGQVAYAGDFIGYWTHRLLFLSRRTVGFYSRSTRRLAWRSWPRSSWRRPAGEQQTLRVDPAQLEQSASGPGESPYRPASARLCPRMTRNQTMAPKRSTRQWIRAGILLVGIAWHSRARSLPPRPKPASRRS